ncbi:MAG: hypothetical protein ACE366_05030 [Bradymonadia bacterium]
MIGRCLTAALLLTLGAVSAQGGTAAEEPPTTDLYTLLGQCPHLALVTPSAPNGQGTMAGAVVHDLTGSWPELITFKGRALDLEEGDLALAVACTPEPPAAGRPTVLGGPILKVRRGLVRPAITFLEDWQSELKTAPTAQLDAWLSHLTHPWAPAREVAFRALMAHRRALKGRLMDGQMDALGEMLVAPERPAGAGPQIIRVLGALTGQEGANMLAAKLPYIQGRRAQHEAVRMLARYPSPMGRRALDRCLKTGGSVLAAHCRRALLKMPGGAGPKGAGR